MELPGILKVRLRLNEIRSMRFGRIDNGGSLMRIALALILLGSLLAVAPTASASCSQSVSVGPDVDEMQASLNDDEAEYVDCTTNVAKGAVERYTTGAVQFAQDTAGLFAPLDIVRSMSCNVSMNGQRMCLG